ncbi:MAG: signal peptidase I [Clostridiales bacterium]|nr:signal peptidase I [Clostridiales bacterium]
MRVTRAFKWILRFIFNTALALLFCLALVLLIPRFFGIAPYVVLSGSMEPRISTGSLVFADTREREPETGDVITYQVDGQNVTHRVVRTENGTCITKGDANTQEDLIPVSPSQIIGRVIFTLPYLGFGVALLRRKVVFPQWYCWWSCHLS